MQKNRFPKLIILGGILMSGLLFSCSTEGEEGKGSPVYQVDYYDETGVQVGYAYAIEGRSGPFKSMEGTNYDWAPHSDMEITNPGSRMVFDKWVGTYDAAYGDVKEGYDGQAIDLNHIQGDCKVVASFKEKAYKIETVFKNNGKALPDGAKVDFGEPISFPATNPTEELAEYYNNYSFTGWILSNDSSSTKHLFASDEGPTYTWKTGANAGTKAWGLGAPSDGDAAGNAGVIYLDKTLVDHMPEYDTYMSDGTKWISLGKLSSDTVKIEYVSQYNRSYKDFTVTLLGIDKTTVVASFNATYAEDITYERSVVGTTTKIAVKYAGETKYTYNIDTTNKVSYLLEGEYLNRNTDPNKHSEAMNHTRVGFTITSDSNDIPVGGSTTLKGNMSIYPLVSDIR